MQLHHSLTANLELHRLHGSASFAHGDTRVSLDASASACLEDATGHHARQNPAIHGAPGDTAPKPCTHSQPDVMELLTNSTARLPAPDAASYEKFAWVGHGNLGTSFAWTTQRGIHPMLGYKPPNKTSNRRWPAGQWNGAQISTTNRDCGWLWCTAGGALLQGGSPSGCGCRRTG